jgi:osmotically-inducible protein OsmY
MRIPLAILVAISTACLVTACGIKAAGDDRRLSANEPSHNTRNDATPVQPDNSAVNARDVKSDDPTAIDQSEAPADRDMTRRIRQAVMADGSLSTNAHNVKIITVDGRATLRGPVKSDSERASIQAKATEIAGANNVDNQLEVKD